MKRVISLMLSFVMIGCLSACGNSEPDTAVISEIEFAKSILVAGTEEKIMALFSDYKYDDEWIVISGTFAGIDGEYEVFIDDDSDDDAKEIEDLIFRHNGEADIKKAIKLINSYMGKYSEYDKESGKYIWTNEEIGLEIKLYANNNDIWIKPLFDYEEEQKNQCSIKGHITNEWTEWDENYDEAEYERELLCLRCDEVIDSETKDMTTYVNGNVFSIHPCAFADRFDAQSERLNGIEFESEAEYKYGDDMMYYLADDNTIYYRIKDGSSDVGMYNFYNTDGKALSRQNNFSANEIAQIDILVEDSYDLAAVIYTTLLTIDPSMEYSYAAEFGQRLQDNLVNAIGDLEEGALDGTDYNGINYLVYRDRSYHYLVVKPTHETAE